MVHHQQVTSKYDVRWRQLFIS